MRIRIVTRMGPAAARSTRFLIGSAAGHVLFALALVLTPSWRSRPPLDPAAAILVQLVAAPPAGGGEVRPPAPVPAPPEPEPQPEEADSQVVPVEPRLVAPVPDPTPPRKPPEKKPEKKPEPKPASKPARKPPEPSVPAPSAPTPSATGPTRPATSPPGVAGSAPGASVSALQGVGDVELGWYKGQVTAALYRSWRKPILDGLRDVREVHVAFEIQRDGRVQDIRLAQESGLPMLDRSALRAVYDAAPMPPLPPNWLEPSLPATFVFRLNPE